MRTFILLSLLLISIPCYAAINQVCEEDGSPCFFPWKIKVANGNLTNNGDGTGSIADQTGGGGTPGGANTQVQFNDSSAFSGDVSLLWDKSPNTLSISRDVGQVGNALVISSDTGVSLARISHDGSAIFGLGGAGGNLGVGSTISMDSGTGNMTTAGAFTSTGGITSSGSVRGTNFNIAGAIILQSSSLALSSSTNAIINNSSASAGSTTLIRGGSSSTSGVTLQSTSGTGVNDVIAFKVGANGGTTGMTITGPNARLRISTDIVSMDATTGPGQLNLFGSTGGCIMFRDTNNSTYTKCTTLSGTLTCAADADGVC